MVSLVLEYLQKVKMNLNCIGCLLQNEVKKEILQIIIHHI